MYKASIIVTISNEYALTENFFTHILSIIKDDINIFTVVDGEADRSTIIFLQNLQRDYPKVCVNLQTDVR